MRIIIAIVYMLISVHLIAQNNIKGIGSWREHYNNTNILQVIKGDRIYIASTNQVMAYDEPSGQLDCIGKSNGLHEIGIEKIAWDPFYEQLIIAYNNSAIDIVKGDQVYLINDIKTTSLFNKKQIINIKVKDALGFVETAFGWVIIDLKKHEIKETWQNKDLPVLENVYQLSKIPTVSNIDFKTDSLKGMALAPNYNKWINIGGPNKPIKGTSATNDQLIVSPFSNKANGFSTYSDKGWSNYYNIQNNEIPVLDIAIANPTNTNFWLANTTAVYNFDGNQMNLIQQSQEGIIKNIGFSKNGTGWVINDQKGLSLYKESKFKNYALPTGLNLDGSVKMIVNQQEQIWISGPSIQGMYIFQSDNYHTTSTWIQKTTGTNNGNLPSNKVTCMTEDKAGAIWVGTDNGMGIFNCGDISKESCNAYLPIVKNNGFNAYLFQKETINCITVDAANRKWIGTNNGTWLLSQDGLDIIEHFTKSNSPLPTDTILQIFIEPKNGEVFFQTSQEIVSYRGTATKEVVKMTSLFIFPNPVPPNYEGPIGIKNLVENGNVKITDINGKLVFQTRALGGQAIWNGKDYEGRKVATGIYLVFVRDDLGNEKGIGKIMITKGY